MLIVKLKTKKNKYTNVMPISGIEYDKKSLELFTLGDKEVSIPLDETEPYTISVYSEGHLIEHYDSEDEA